MPPRASWKGHLNISLVTIPVRLYHAISGTSRIELNQLHDKGCGARIRHETVCPRHGPVERKEIVRGYEFEPDRYVLVDDEDLARIKLETTHSIEVLQFSPEQEVDPTYLDTHYYLAPNGPVAAEAFAVIREAMRRTNQVAIGQVVMAGKEKLLVIRADGNGLAMSTLHYADEVQDSSAYFEDIPAGVTNDEQLRLSEQLVRVMSAPFKPKQFTDHYQEALLQIIKAQIAQEPVVVEEEKILHVVDFMDALQQSVSAMHKEVRKKPPARSIRVIPERQRKKKSTRE